jgi:hypothetical protein
MMGPSGMDPYGLRGLPPTGLLGDLTVDLHTAATLGGAAKVAGSPLGPALQLRCIGS